MSFFERVHKQKSRISVQKKLWWNIWEVSWTSPWQTLYRYRTWPGPLCHTIYIYVYQPCLFFILLHQLGTCSRRVQAIVHREGLAIRKHNKQPTPQIHRYFRWVHPLLHRRVDPHVHDPAVLARGSRQDPGLVGGRDLFHNFLLH